MNLMRAIHTSKPARARAGQGPRRTRLDPHLKGAAERVEAAAKELKRRGIADADGKRIRADLPKDMREGEERDFGG